MLCTKSEHRHRLPPGSGGFSRWGMSGSDSRFPKSLIEFQSRFATEAACAKYLFERRWPDGFVCPGCGGGRAWGLKTKPFTYECAACGRQTSVTAGTIMHASKLPLTAWFWAAFLMANALQRHFGSATAEPAWPRLVPNRLDVVRQVTPLHARPGSPAVARHCRGR